eukprot:TRINITY_DN104455_c0_g1_i1.p1 TRINITY_DN104455_c0_g1~~TRINITY_DN104455_c0_g1_i1.p1  ORF type:complete len:561 (-),score=159.79 TRINITY_DN104455_c0_g1_i1:42-1724(-)
MRSHPSSPSNWPGSPKAPSWEEVLAERRLLFQNFFDDWHYRIVNCKLARTWGRSASLGLLLEVLELLGLPLPAKGGREALLKLEEQDVTEYLAENMPEEGSHDLKDLSRELGQVVCYLMGLRQSIEAGDVEAMTSAFKGDLSVGRHVLQQAVQQGCLEAKRLRAVHGSWYKSTEARIERLENARQEAESSMQQSLFLEEQYAALRGLQSERSQACLAAFVSAGLQARLSGTFQGWRWLAEESKAEKELQRSYEAQIEAMQQQLQKLQDGRQRCIQGEVQRCSAKLAAETARATFRAWSGLCAELRLSQERKKQLVEVTEKLSIAKSQRAESAKKMMCKMISDQDAGPLMMCWQSWLQYSRERKSELQAESSMMALDKRLQEALAQKTDRLTGVLGRMLDRLDFELLAEVVESWQSWASEEKRVRTLDSALSLVDSKLGELKAQHAQSAHGVCARMHRQHQLISLERHWSSWVLQTKTTLVEQHFRRKLDFKRKQLGGVQALFQSFATQIEASLDFGPDDDETRRTGHDWKPRGKPPKGGLQKGSAGTVSLPDIRQKPVGG